jgi:hypothetical protein
MRLQAEWMVIVRVSEVHYERDRNNNGRLPRRPRLSRGTPDRLVWQEIYISITPVATTIGVFAALQDRQRRSWVRIHRGEVMGRSGRQSKGGDAGNELFVGFTGERNTESSCWSIFCRGRATAHDITPTMVRVDDEMIRALLLLTF